MKWREALDHRSSKPWAMLANPCNLWETTTSCFVALITCMGRICSATLVKYELDFCATAAKSWRCITQQSVWPFVSLSSATPLDELSTSGT